MEELLPGSYYHEYTMPTPPPILSVLPPFKRRIDTGTWAQPKPKRERGGRPPSTKAPKAPKITLENYKETHRLGTEPEYDSANEDFFPRIPKGANVSGYLPAEVRREFNRPTQPDNLAVAVGFHMDIPSTMLTSITTGHPTPSDKTIREVTRQFNISRTTPSLTWSIGGCTA
jgi:hypothetical protein